MDRDMECETVTSEVRLVEEIDASLGKMPRNLEALLSSLEDPDINDCTVALLYTLMIETGFEPVNAQNTDDNVQTCCGFNAKKVGTHSKMPDGWKKRCGKSYEMNFRIAPFLAHECRLLVLSMLDLLVVDLFIEKHLDVDESPFVSCFTVCPSNHVTVSTSSPGESRVKYNNILELAHQFKDTISSPARANILNKCGITNPSLLGLPEEVTLKLLTYLEVKDIGNAARTCKFLNGVSKDQHLWFYLVNRDWKLNELWRNDVNWRTLYERKDIESRCTMKRKLDRSSYYMAERIHNFHPTILMPGFNPHPFRNHPFYPPGIPGMHDSLFVSFSSGLDYSNAHMYNHIRDASNQPQRVDLNALLGQMDTCSKK